MNRAVYEDRYAPGVAEGWLGVYEEERSHTTGQLQTQC